jgi:hypothetical protein
MLPGLLDGLDFSRLTVALSGRVLAFKWAGGGVLWRAERQTVVRVGRPAPLQQRLLVERTSRTYRHPDDPDGRAALVSPVAPRDSGPIRLDLPASAPVLPVSHDDAGWCAVSSTFEYARKSLVLI